MPYRHLHIYPCTTFVHSVVNIPKEESPSPNAALCSRNMITVNSHVCRKAKRIYTSLNPLIRTPILLTSAASIYSSLGGDRMYASIAALNAAKAKQPPAAA